MGEKKEISVDFVIPHFTQINVHIRYYYIHLDSLTFKEFNLQFLSNSM